MKFDPHLHEQVNREVELEEKRGNRNVPEKNRSTAQMTPKVISSPRSYIQVPQFGIAIAQRETHKGKNMYDTLDALAAENLQMPSPAQFMTHWMNVREAYENKRQIVYADGTPVEKDRVNDLWGYMSSTDRSPWNGTICWTWLNALFRNGNIGKDLKVVTDAKGNRCLAGKPETLQSYVGENGFVSLDFNSQGLATTPSGQDSYKQGSNMYFWKPGNGTVAWFVADSGGAYLGCGGPTDASPSLGVFASAPVGARSALENSEGRK
jgi:hypothetical protein